MADQPAKLPAPGKLPAFDPAVIAQLACPACYGDLRLKESHIDESHLDDSSLLCIACRRVYAIVDGIPVLIPTADH